MKKLITIIAIVALWAGFGTVKADVYTDGLRQLIGEHLISAVDVPDMLSQQSAGGVAVIDSTIAVMAPYYRANMSEDEFRQMVDYMTQSASKEALQKVLTASNNFNPSEAVDLMNVMKQSLAGEDPAPIEAKECTPEFKKAFGKYMDLTNSIEKVNCSVDALMLVMSQVIPGPDGEIKDKIMGAMGKMMNYIKDNSMTIMQNVLSSSVSADDINECCKLYEQPFSASMKKTEDAIIADMPEILGKMMSSMGAIGLPE